MPLDFTNPNPSLRDQLAFAGITPVPIAVLEAHKTAQLRKYRPSLLATPWPYLLVGLLACGLFLATRTGQHPIPDIIIAVMMIVAAMMATRLVVGAYCHITNTKLLGHPQWFEVPLSPTWIDYPLSHSWVSRVPEPIREVMQRAKFLQGKLLYGHLVQNTIVLDPYIVVQGPDGRYCLGIWENDEVIACATLH